MNAHNVNAERLLTWLDVERLLKQRTALWTQLPLGNLCINPQRMCLHMGAGCGSIPAHAAN